MAGSVIACQKFSVECRPGWERLYSFFVMRAGVILAATEKGHQLLS
jgi:hypothetical protein